MFLVNIDDIDLILNASSRHAQLAALFKLPFLPHLAVVIDNGRPLSDYETAMVLLRPFCAGFVVTVQDSYAEGEGGEALFVSDYVAKYLAIRAFASQLGRPVIYEVGNEVNLLPPYQSPDIWEKVGACLVQAAALGDECGVTFFDDGTIAKFLLGRPKLTFKWGFKSCYPANPSERDTLARNNANKEIVGGFLQCVGATDFAIREYGDEEWGPNHFLDTCGLIQRFESLPGGGYWDFQHRIVKSDVYFSALSTAWKMRKTT